MPRWWDRSWITVGSGTEGVHLEVKKASQAGRLGAQMALHVEPAGAAMPHPQVPELGRMLLSLEPELWGSHLPFLTHTSLDMLQCRHSYLWPLGVQKLGLDGVVQSSLVLLDLHICCRAVAVEDAILGIDPQGFAIEKDGSMVVTRVASLVALSYLLHKLSLTQGWPAGPLILKAF